MGLTDLFFPVANQKTEIAASGASAQVSPSSSAVSDDLTHVTQEMYKKNFELSEKNKMLSVLRKIDEIILSSVTETQEIAKAVTKLLVDEAEFRIAGIYIIDDGDGLRRLSVYVSESTYLMGEKELKAVNSTSMAAPHLKNNLLIEAIRDKEIKQTTDLADVIMYDTLVTEDGAKKIQESSEVKATIVYPLIVRDVAIGAFFISVNETVEDLSEYQKDLLARLHIVIGIAMDNALLYKQVQEANAKLQALDKLKDEFVSLASHELRTPMTAIKAYIWMALDGRGGELNEKLKYYLSRAYMSTDRLINLVNDMLNISRIESGRLSVAMDAVDLYKLAQEIVEEVTPKSQEVGVAVILDPLPSPLPPVLADSDKIKEVFINLVGNSLKFTPKGGNIHIQLTQQGDMVETKIVDTGNGVDPADLPKLFQKFAMLEGSYTANQPVQGTGLGLYICRAIIEMHKGTIAATSEGHGKGATFTFTLRVFNEEDKLKYSVVGNGAKVSLVHSQI